MGYEAHLACNAVINSIDHKSFQTMLFSPSKSLELENIHS